MVPYLGDFDEDETVYIAFNTFTSDDPSASATITNLADADIKVHKDGGTTQLGTDGATVAINFDSITGNHLITIDTSAHGDYTTGADYHVRIEGTTVDGATINAWVGHFSILNRSHTADISAILADTNELQSDDIPGSLSTLSGKVDTIDDFLDTEVAAILADTNELQTDWTNGGRLDLLLDATLADTAELQGDWANGGRLDLLIDSIISKVDVVDGIVDSILVDTAVIGSAGAGLSAVTTQVLTTQMTESYAANGTAPTLAQAIFAMHQKLLPFAYSGTGSVTYKLDNSTTAFTGTLDDASSPTSDRRVP